MSGLTHREVWNLHNPHAQTWLYRIYSTSGTLLYVGISRTPRARISTHRRDKPWFPGSGWSVATPYRNRAEALAAELKAISDENPHFNLVGPGWRRSLRVDRGSL